PDEGGGGTAGAMARALLLGESEALPVAWLLALRRLGLGHLIAVSGLHVGLAAGVVWLGLAALAPQRRWAPVAVSVGLYLALVGARPSLLRASVMTLIALASLATERRPITRNAWAAAIGGMVLWQPRLLLDLGFQLTAAATLGLICLAPALTRRWREVLPAWLALALAAGVAAHLFTLPWSVGVFFLWSPISILLNLVAVPWTAVTLVVSFAVLVAGDLPGIGSAAWWLLDRVVAPFGWLAELPVAAWASWPTMLSPRLAAALAAVVGWSLARARPALAGAICLLGAGLLLRGGDSDPLHPLTGGGPGGEVHRARGAEAVLLDVGQGEAIVLRHGARVVLVDGGGWLAPGIGQRVLLPALVRLGVRRLDAVVLTHPDRDHCGGLVEIVHLVEVDELWSSPGWRGPCHRHLVGRAGLRLRPLWRGVERRVGAWKLTALHPPAGDRSRGNERSLVLRAETTGGSILLTGDVGTATERLLVAERGSAVAADVLKLGHHGSRHSTSERFLDRVRPRLAVVSAGAGNSYGHPAEEVLDRLAARRIPLYRTDRGGQIRLRPMATGAWRIEQPWRRTLP
ncbi:MAG: ComEC/Rec2 family competence protein, partial [Thermoanaerobaculia bacterium]|nr:ComEC/Rec2 family competence protein [Thermoanaerobaculia bacterium]